jgi:hypothetical protein
MLRGKKQKKSILLRGKGPQARCFFCLQKKSGRVVGRFAALLVYIQRLLL